VRDRVFSGEDVEAALRTAGESLGVPPARLRYVVLEAGAHAGRGLKPTPARVAVMLDEEPASGPARRAERPETAAEAVRATIAALARAAGIDVRASLEDDEREGPVRVRLSGSDEGFWLGADGRGEVLRALEHLLQRMHGAAFLPRPLRLECAGFRERRDAALAEEGRRLAEAVRADGLPRRTEPLNSYERRLVHLAVGACPGVRSFSEGEGAARRVTVVPAPTADPGAASGGADGPA
jgi:spoIIIJ-associated protein